MGRFNEDIEETVVVDGLVLATTEKAILVRVEGDGVDHWIPKSQILSGDDDPEVGDDIEIEIPGWLAEKQEIG